MNKNYWLQKWRKNDIAFHQNMVNPFLIKYFNQLPLTIGQRIFVPLCGKTNDIAWLLTNGYEVVGAELSEQAIKQLFHHLNISPQISKIGNLSQYKAQNIKIFVGDLFDLTTAILPNIHAVYDRAALVALPKDIRIQYTSHLTDITQNTPQLVITYEYDQVKMDGPPFSISDEEIYYHYEKNYDPILLTSIDVTGGLKGLCEAKEKAWLLKRK
ncbi:thiopurine S-methyltransferase [Aliikangiella sp. IMCC44359]|uniref:thiopurine S-methyltransferase n=1 Tax=Aliikangiella sp. IMCC44359 TaxID=3459125 RepID=UPI00403AFC44